MRKKNGTKQKNKIMNEDKLAKIFARTEKVLITLCIAALVIWIIAWS